MTRLVPTSKDHVGVYVQFGHILVKTSQGKRSLHWSTNAPSPSKKHAQKRGCTRSFIGAVLPIIPSAPDPAESAPFYCVFHPNHRLISRLENHSTASELFLLVMRYFWVLSLSNLINRVHGCKQKNKIKEWLRRPQGEERRYKENNNKRLHAGSRRTITTPVEVMSLFLGPTHHAKNNRKKNTN